MFKNTEIDAGHLKVGREVTLEYPYEDIRLVTRITSPCDCTDVKNDWKNNKVVVKYKPKDVPEHLKAIGKYSYSVNKVIEVAYTNTSGQDCTQKLILKATIS